MIASGVTQAGAVVNAAGKVALDAGAAASKIAGEQMLTAAAQIDKAAIATGEKIAGKVGGEAVAQVTQHGTKIAKAVGKTTGKVTSELAANVTTEANAKVIGKSAQHLSTGGTKLKMSEKTNDGVNAVAEEVQA